MLSAKQNSCFKICGTIQMIKWTLQSRYGKQQTIIVFQVLQDDYMVINRFYNSFVLCKEQIRFIGYNLKSFRYFSKRNSGHKKYSNIKTYDIFGPLF